MTIPQFAKFEFVFLQPQVVGIEISLGLFLVFPQSFEYFKYLWQEWQDYKEMRLPIQIGYREPILVAVANVAQPWIWKTSGELVSAQEPSPQIGFPVGNQACIVPRLL